MKILFKDALRGATFTSVNASPNYPARNLGDAFLRLRYQANNTSDSVTITLASPATVDALYLGYVSGVTTVGVELYVADVGQGAAPYFASYAGEEFASAHFAPVTNVNKIVLTFAGTDPFYVGGVGAGAALDLPAPEAAWEDALTDNSVVVRSQHGQVQQQYIEPLRRFLFTFLGVDSADFLAIKAAAASLGRRPAWVTLFEESAEDFPPGYYSVTLGNPQRDKRQYRFTFTFEEAR